MSRVVWRLEELMDVPHPLNALWRRVHQYHAAISTITGRTHIVIAKSGHFPGSNVASIRPSPPAPVKTFTNPTPGTDFVKVDTKFMGENETHYRQSLC